MVCFEHKLTFADNPPYNTIGYDSHIHSLTLYWPPDHKQKPRRTCWLWQPLNWTYDLDQVNSQRMPLGYEWWLKQVLLELELELEIGSVILLEFVF